LNRSELGCCCAGGRRATTTFLDFVPAFEAAVFDTPDFAEDVFFAVGAVDFLGTPFAAGTLRRTAAGSGAAGEVFFFAVDCPPGAEATSHKPTIDTARKRNLTPFPSSAAKFR
jgi:hypothetical protein